MKIVSMVCPNCGASIQVDADKKNLTCNYCGNNLFVDDEVQHIRYDNADEAGYQFEKGRQRAQAEANYSAMNSNVQPKKRRTWLWVLGWLCIFPLPLTILMLRKKEMKPGLKYGVIAAAWIVYLIIGVSGNSGNNVDSSTSTRGNVAVERAETDTNIKELSFIKSGDQTVKIGETTSESYVKVKLKDKNSFTSDDVIFVSEDPEIATIEFTKVSSTSYVYYKITGVAAGETYVYASSKDGSITSEKLKVIVEGSGANITDISFTDKEDVTVRVGQDVDGVVNVTLKNTWSYSQDDVVFVSDNPDVATIEFVKASYGKTVYYKIHGVSQGQTTVYAQSNDGVISSNKITVTVPEPVKVESITLDQENLTIGVGETASVTAAVLPEEADNKEIKWSSSDTAIAIIDEKGYIVGTADGTCVITAESSDGISASLNLTVDGSRRLMSLRVTHPRDDDNNIGSEWSFYNEVNGERTKNEYSIAVGDTLSFYSKYVESDDNPDVGETRTSHTVTEEDLQNGFTVTMDLYVKENAGRNSGKSAHFVVTYSFTLK